MKFNHYPSVFIGKRNFRIIIAAVTIFLLGSVIENQAQVINVMTYNIRYDNPNDGVNQWSQRKTKVFDLIKKYNPDIVGVQEALLHQLEDMIQALPEYTHIGVGRDDGKTKGEYSALLYKKNKFNVKDQNTFWLSETPDEPGSKSWDAAITRVATWAKLQDRKTKKMFLVINTHFDHIGKEARRNSAFLLKKKASELNNKLPAVILGDFNCTRDEPPYQTLMDDSTGVLIDPAPQNPSGTFCSFEVNSIKCNPIDYIFHSTEWKSKNYHVITDNDGKYYPSDHLPVMVEVALK